MDESEGSGSDKEGSESERSSVTVRSATTSRRLAGGMGRGKVVMQEGRGRGDRVVERVAERSVVGLAG